MPMFGLALVGLPALPQRRDHARRVVAPPADVRERVLAGPAIHVRERFIPGVLRQRADGGRERRMRGADLGEECLLVHRGEHAPAATAPSVRLARPELAVARVAEAGLDVALLVEPAVQRRAVDVDVRVGRRDRRHALRRRDQVDQLDPGPRPTS